VRLPPRAAWLLPLALPLTLASCGIRDPASRSWNESLAALAAGDLQAAEIAAEKSAAAGGRAFAARRDFLLALTASRRSAAAEARAGIPGAAASSYARALAAAEEARQHAESAILGSAEDWPAARRNWERIMARIARLKPLHEAALRDPSANREPPPPKEDAPGSERLLERLGQQEEQKRTVRRAAAANPAGGVEQDW